jgi:nicotinamide-nucleotide amidase
MTFSVSILATGSELLDGRVVDTNSNFVARELTELGLKLHRVLVVDDDLGELVEGLRELSRVSDLVITSGGLGPTDDDMTRDAVALFSGVGLREHPDARNHLEAFYRKRNRVLDDTNLKQALLPANAEMIPNELGTAPGFKVEPAVGRTVCSLSGVPREFKSMFYASILPLIAARVTNAPKWQRVSLKLFGLPESLVGKLVKELQLPGEIVVSYRASFPEVHLVLKANAEFNLAPHAERVRDAVSRGVIYTESYEESFEGVLHAILTSKHETIACAESCTGGLVSEMLTRTPGSSASFIGGIVAYSNQVKESELGVSQETLQHHGAVSAQAVREMAKNVQTKLSATYGVSISGIAGPAGGSEEKPVGTFFIGVAGPAGVFDYKVLYVSDRRGIRTYAAYVALDLVRRIALGLPIPHGGYPIAQTITSGAS